MRRLVVLAAAAIAASVGVGILTAAGGAQAPGERTFKLIEEEGTFGFVDNPPRARSRRNPSLSAGDTVAITSRLFDEANRRVGTLHAVCTVTRAGRNFARASLHCSGTFLLRDGTLALSVTFRGAEAAQAGVAVVGGTGAYEGARGSVSSRGLPGDRTEDTVHLLP